MKYPNIFHSENQNRLRIIEAEEKDDKSKRELKLIPGVQVTNVTRPRIINTLISYFTDRSITIRSQRLLNELQTFIWGKQQGSGRFRFSR